MRLKDSAKAEKGIGSYRSTEAALPLLLPRVRVDPRACSEPDPERGDVRETYGDSG